MSQTDQASKQNNAASDTERPTPLVEDIEGTKLKLENWLALQLGSDGAVSIPNLAIPEGTGMSNVTLLFDAEYEKNGQKMREACVGRLQPEIEKPVFPEYDLSVQYRAMDIVGRHTDVPVPDLMGLEQNKDVLGTEFYVMRRAHGRVPSDMPPYNMDGWMIDDCDPELRRAMWVNSIETMASLHKQTKNTKALGFDAFLADLEPGNTPLEQQLNYWKRYQAWSMSGEAHSIVDPALQWLFDNQPKNEEWGLSWGDSRFANMMFNDDGSVSKVLDWEMIRLGNPLQDIAYWNYMDFFFSEGLGMPRLEGLPNYEESVELWSEKSGFGFTEESYNYYFVYTGVRYGAILSRIMLGQGQQDQVIENFATDILRKVVEQRC